MLSRKLGLNKRAQAAMCLIHIHNGELSDHGACKECSNAIRLLSRERFSAGSQPRVSSDLECGNSRGVQPHPENSQDKRTTGGGGTTELHPPLREGAELGPGSDAWEMGDYVEPAGSQVVEDDFAEVKRLRLMQQAAMRPSLEVPRGPRKGRAQRDAEGEAPEASAARQSMVAGPSPGGGRAAVLLPAPASGPTGDAEAMEAGRNTSTIQQKSRRSSFIDFFRSKPVEPATDSVRGLRKTSSSANHPPPSSQSFAELKSRRASFIDFFR